MNIQNTNMNELRTELRVLRGYHEYEAEKYQLGETTVSPSKAEEFRAYHLESAMKIAHTLGEADEPMPIPHYVRLRLEEGIAHIHREIHHGNITQLDVGHEILLRTWTGVQLRELEEKLGKLLE